jgi:hypothetical protein
MATQQIWRVEDRRTRRRFAAEFYAIELDERGRYLRWVANMSDEGLLIESPLGVEMPGQRLELELPRRYGEKPLRVQAEVVYVTPSGQVGVRIVSAPLPLDTLGGRLAL